MERKPKILIDMDIGDDIDDAIALYFAMKQGFEIVGVTTVFCNTVERARQARKLMMAFGNGYENVPVYAGHGVTTEGKLPFPHINHYSSDIEAPEYQPTGVEPDEAVNFIIESCEKYGKDLTVIAIGPFTNIARVIEKDPRALSKAAGVMIMGGAFYKQYADWNVMCDVPAADIMFRGLDNLECIGADVTHLMLAEQELYDELLNYEGDDPARKYLTELFRIWRADRPQAKLLLHDPLVIYYAADPAICEMKKASVIVMTEGVAKGLTFNVDAYGKRRLNSEAYEGADLSKKVSVAFGVDKETFDKRILSDIRA